MDTFIRDGMAWSAVARQQTRFAAPARPLKDVLRSRQSLAGRVRSASIAELRSLAVGKRDALLPPPQRLSLPRSVNMNP
jgi:hypothetical protein